MIMGISISVVFMGTIAITMFAATKARTQYSQYVLARPKSPLESFIKKFFTNILLSPDGKT